MLTRSVVRCRSNALYFVPPTAGPAPQNWANWNLDFAAAGTYRVEAYTDGSYGTRPIHSAVYQIEHAGRLDAVTIDQSAVAGWSLMLVLVMVSVVCNASQTPTATASSPT